MEEYWDYAHSIKHKFSYSLKKPKEFMAIVFPETMHEWYQNT